MAIVSVVAGITIVLCVYILAEKDLFVQGYDTNIFAHKTEQEKRIREAKIRLLENQAAIKHRNIGE